MVTWSQIILKLVSDGYTPDEIVERVSIPFVNLEYVNNVLEQRAIFHRRRFQSYRKQTTVPGEGTLTKRVYDKVQELGGNEAFLEKLKTISMVQLAKEWDMPWHAVYNYKRDFIVGAFCEGQVQGTFISVPYMIERKKQIANPKLRKRKKLTIKDVRNLW